MSGYVDTGIFVLRVLRAASQIAQYAEELYLKKSVDHEDEVTERVNTVFKTAILGFEITKSFAGVESQADLNHFEGLLRMGKTIFHLNLAAAETDPAARKLVWFNAAAEFLGSMRCFAEEGALVQDKYLAKTDEELASELHPIYKSDTDGNGITVIGYRPYTRQECQKAKDSAIAAANTCSAVEMGARVKVISDFPVSAPIAPAPAPAPAAPVAPALVAAATAGPDSMFDFIHFSEIPVELHRDPVLSSITCRITFAPIRYPVVVRGGDPRHIFEKAALTRHIQTQQQSGIATTHPLTRASMTLDDIVTDHATQGVINARLQKLATILRDRFGSAIENETIATPA